MLKKAGFTLLEIVVVIAIIGILTGVVLTLLSSARTSAADATIKSSLEGLRKEASVFFNDDQLGNGSYGSWISPTFVACTQGNSFFTSSALACGSNAGILSDGSLLCVSPNIKSRALIMSAINARDPQVALANASRCRLFPGSNNTDGWVAAVVLRSDINKVWCVDSSGNSNAVALVPGGGIISVFSGSSLNTCPAS